jgi:hypothetical protein
VSESAASAKRSWVWFGAKPAQSETPVRAAVKRRLPGGGAVGKRSGAAWKLGRCSLRHIFISANALGGLRRGVDSGFQHSESLDEVVERKRLVNKHFAHCLVVLLQQLVQRLVRHKFRRCWKSGIVIHPSSLRSSSSVANVSSRLITAMSDQWRDILRFSLCGSGRWFSAWISVTFSQKVRWQSRTGTATWGSVA